MTAQTPPLPEYLNPPKLSRMLGINVDKVLTWIRNGEIRAIDVSTNRGGRPRWRIHRADLDEFLTHVYSLRRARDRCRWVLAGDTGGAPGGCVAIQKAVTYWNEQLMPICGIGSRKRLVIARQAAVPAVMLPDGEVRFDRDELLRWIDDHRQPGQEATATEGVDA